ncbi:LOW QUALITY PROTEIN: putative G-protein coupled receptor 156 [Gastrophryne carolinensis]
MTRLNNYTGLMTDMIADNSEDINSLNEEVILEILDYYEVVKGHREEVKRIQAKVPGGFLFTPSPSPDSSLRCDWLRGPGAPPIGWKLLDDSPGRIGDMEPALNCSAMSVSHMDATLDGAGALAVLQDMCRLPAGAAESRTISSAVTGVMGSLLTCALLLSLFCFIFTVRFRQNRIVKMSSPNLNLVVVLGSVLSYISAFMFSAQEQVAAIIQVRISILYIGVSLVFGPLLGKSWRLHRVFTHRVPDKRVIIKDLTLLGLQAALLFIDSLLLLSWVLADPVLCSQDISASIKAAERGTLCSMSRSLSCSSRHPDFWLILLLGFKGILLVYGTYLAGLTKNISNPPVNQSLVIMVGTTLAVVATGLVLLVTRHFPAWPSLVYGVTSGSILACTATINCLIFIPQVLQWRHFEEEAGHSNPHMAKYFNNPSKSMKSMYSEEQIYQLLGENTSMRRLLTEKNAVIDSLQEQVTNARKLVQLLRPECSVEVTEVSSLSSSVFIVQQQSPPLAHATSKTAIKAPGEQANHSLQEEDSTDAAASDPPPSGEDPQESQANAPQPSESSTPKPEGGRATVSRNISFADSAESKDKGSDSQSEAWERLATKVNYVSTEKLQEILRELSSETLLGGGQPSPRRPRRASHSIYRDAAAPSEGPCHVCPSLSPYTARRKRSLVQSRRYVSPSLNFRRYSSYNARDRYASCRDSHAGAIRPVRTNEELSPTAFQQNTELCVHPEAARAQENGGLWIKKLSDPPGPPRRPSHSINWTRPGRTYTGRGDLRSATPISELDTSSSEETLCYCHRPYCDICAPTFESSDSEAEHGDDLQGWVRHPSVSRPVVNFNEDLQPTLV